MNAQNETAAELEKYIPGLVGAKSDKGPVRATNEDAYWIADANTPTELGALYVVADGVGGQEDGAAAAHLAVLMVRDTFYDRRQNGATIATALEEAINRANQAIYEEAGTRGGGRMGSTLVAAVQDQDQLYVAHVGDARAYLVQDGKLYRLTKDDTWVQKQVEAGLIKPEEAAEHELRNVVTQVLGNKPEVEIHLSKPRPLRDGDIFLLCSDGLYEALPGKELFRLLTGSPPPDAARALIEAATKAGASDNITAVVVKSSERKSAGLIPAAGQHAGRNSIPLWLWLFFLAAILLLATVSLLWLRRPDQPQLDTTVAGNGPVVPRPQDEGSNTPPTSMPAAVASPLPTFTLPAVDIVAPQATSTIRPTATATPLPTATITATPLPSPTPPVFACVVSDPLFVWQDGQIDAGTCGHFAEEGFVLTPGDQVQVTDLNTRSVAGPDASCLANDFIRVQSRAEPEIEGWVLRNGIRLLPAGESCNP
jgi:serine/threonine protein phosphatase PrpC